MAAHTPIKEESVKITGITIGFLMAGKKALAVRTLRKEKVGLSLIEGKIICDFLQNKWRLVGFKRIQRNYGGLNPVEVLLEKGVLKEL